MRQKPVQVVVANQELRRMFNEGRYWERMKAGEFFEVLYREGHPSPRDSHEPPCTRSQIIAYLDGQGRQVAIVHQYLRKDGHLGGSGQPDPKKLFHQGKIYVA
ncbi:MAG TPA: hypothetical protein VGR55_05630 [Candidatus Acidoferrum sp.]|nr:hypothetical protein [Candidatus Acidoferrum sp.]